MKEFYILNDLMEDFDIPEDMRYDKKEFYKLRIYKLTGCTYISYYDITYTDGSGYNISTQRSYNGIGGDTLDIVCIMFRNKTGSTHRLKKPAYCFRIIDSNRVIESNIMCMLEGDYASEERMVNYIRKTIIDGICTE